MANKQRSEDMDGEQESDGPDETGVVFFDVGEMSDEESEWWRGPDYTRAQRAAEQGGDALRRILRGVTHHGTQVRIKAWCTRDGEPVTRGDLHPEGWLELEARIHDLEERAADGDRYRQLMAQREGQQHGDVDAVPDEWWRQWCPLR